MAQIPTWQVLALLCCCFVVTLVIGAVAFVVARSRRTRSQ
jgi:hypothetical protein